MSRSPRRSRASPFVRLVPKGQVSVNADNAVIYLRGQLESDEQIEKLMRATHAIEGVNGVENLLHTLPTTTEGF